MDTQLQHEVDYVRASCRRRYGLDVTHVGTLDDSEWARFLVLGDGHDLEALQAAVDAELAFLDLAGQVDPRSMRISTARVSLHRGEHGPDGDTLCPSADGFAVTEIELEQLDRPDEAAGDNTCHTPSAR